MHRVAENGEWGGAELDRSRSDLRAILRLSSVGLITAWAQRRADSRRTLKTSLDRWTTDRTKSCCSGATDDTYPSLSLRTWRIPRTQCNGRRTEACHVGSFLKPLLERHAAYLAFVATRLRLSLSSPIKVHVPAFQTSEEDVHIYMFLGFLYHGRD